MKKIIFILFILSISKPCLAQFIEYHSTTTTPNINGFIDDTSAKNRTCLNFIVDFQIQILNIKQKTTEAGLLNILNKYYDTLERYKELGYVYLIEDELLGMPLNLKNELINYKSNQKKSTPTNLRTEILRYNCYKVVRKTSLGIERSEETNFAVVIEQSSNKSFIRLNTLNGPIGISLDLSTKEYRDGFIIFSGKKGYSEVMVILQNLDNGGLIVSLKENGSEELNSYCCMPL